MTHSDPATTKPPMPQTQARQIARKHPFCLTCRFWDVMAAREYGQCRRRAPRVIASGTTPFPQTKLTDWSGEYKAISNKKGTKE